MTTAGFTGARGPVHDDKAEAHYHKQEADPGKTGRLEEKGEKISQHSEIQCIFLQLHCEK